MAKCEICGKGVTFGIKVSHSHRRSNRTWKANVRSVRALVNGTPKKVNVCTRCLRSGKVTRAVWFLKKIYDRELFSSLFFLFSHWFLQHLVVKCMRGYYTLLLTYEFLELLYIKRSTYSGKNCYKRWQPPLWWRNY